MKLTLVLLFVLPSLFAALAYGEAVGDRVQVADPYLDLHTGPGASYPVTNVVERGAWVEVVKQRIDWFKVRTENGQTGWAPRHQLERTLTPSGERARFRQVDESDYAVSTWEVGFMGVDFEWADLISAYVGLAFNRNLSVELSLGQALGNYSNSYLGSVSLVSQPFPLWRFSPYLSLGGGVIKTEPQRILIRAEEQSFNASHVGLGLRAYLSRQFMVKLEYKSHVLFNSDQDNEEVNEWKAGFAAFF